jgi:hypothetical protein
MSKTKLNANAVQTKESARPQHPVIPKTDDVTPSMTTNVEPPKSKTRSGASRNTISGREATPAPVNAPVKTPSLTTSNENAIPKTKTSAQTEEFIPLNNRGIPNIPSSSFDYMKCEKNALNDSDYEQGATEDSEPNELNELLPETVYNEKSEGSESEHELSSAVATDEEKQSSAAGKGILSVTKSDASLWEKDPWAALNKIVGTFLYLTNFLTA